MSDTFYTSFEEWERAFLAVPKRVQLLRTSSQNLAPGTLLPGELSAELSGFTKLWIGSETGNRLLLSDNPADANAAGTHYLRLTGGALSGGLSFGGAIAASPATLSRHIQLHTAGYGFSITGGRLNIVAELSAVIVIGTVASSADVVSFNTAGMTVGPSRNITLAADPTSALHAVTKQYSDRNRQSSNIDVNVGTVVLTAAQADYAVLSFVGAPAAPVDVTLPVTGTRRVWSLRNTTATQSAIVRGTAGGTVTIPPGGSMTVWTDSAGIYPLNTTSGALTIPGTGVRLTLGDATANQFTFNVNANAGGYNTITTTGLLQFNGSAAVLFNQGVSSGGNILSYATNWIQAGQASGGNSIQLRPAVAGSNPAIVFAGIDTNINVDFVGKGTGVFRFDRSVTMLAGTDILLNRAPTADLHAASKAYVDAHPGAGGPFLPLSGGVLTSPGNLTTPGTIRATSGRMIVQNSGGNASFTVYDTNAGNAYGIWHDGAGLAFGGTDANGGAVVFFANFTAGGNLAFGGGSTVIAGRDPTGGLEVATWQFSERRDSEYWNLGLATFASYDWVNGNFAPIGGVGGGWYVGGNVDAGELISRDIVRVGGGLGIHYAGVTGEYIGLYTPDAASAVLRSNLRGDLWWSVSASDLRLKRNFAAPSGALVDLALFRVHEFDVMRTTAPAEPWQLAPVTEAVQKHYRYGLIADELLEHAPDCAIDHGADYPNLYKGLDLPPIVARCVKGIQELTGIAAVFEERLAAIERYLGFTTLPA